MKILRGVREKQPDQPKARDDRNRSKTWHQQHDAEKQQDLQNQMGFEVLGILPHAVHAQLQMDQSSVWCSLKPESLVVSADDIFLKHGVVIPGQWHILGILDAQPDDEKKEPQAQYEAAEATMKAVGDNAITTFVTKGFGGFIDGIAPFARMLLGRQSRSYGMTPLLVFRAVTG
jgi:hypothetical protein